MTSRIVLPAVVIVLAVALASGDKIKCYTCYSIGSANDECNGDIMVKSKIHEPVECGVNALLAWHRQIEKVPGLAKIGEVFKIADGTSQTEMDVPMACMKMSLRVDNQPVMLRACQTAKSEQLDTCNALTKLISQNSKYNQHAQVQNCTMCNTDSCNGSYGLTPTMTLALVPLVGSLLMSLVYGRA